MKQGNHVFCFVVMVSLVLTLTDAFGVTLLSENFNGISGGSAGTQADTSLGLKASATLPSWSSSGSGDLHAVNLDGSGNWAIMFFQDNVMTMTTGVEANNSGTRYRVAFDYGTAVYSGLSQKTEATDSLLVEVLRTDNSVLAASSPEWSGFEMMDEQKSMETVK